MADFEGEKWVELYQKALLELEHAKMRGPQRDRATDDALNALGF
jgi:hypothetical protein